MKKRRQINNTSDYTPDIAAPEVEPTAAAPYTGGPPLADIRAKYAQGLHDTAADIAELEHWAREIAATLAFLRAGK